MRIRPGPFFTYLLICLAPLLLLAVLNYWNGMRTLDAIVSADLQDHLTAFTGGVNVVLNAQENEIMRLALAPSTQQFVAARETALGDLASSGLSPDKSAASNNNVSLPAELSSSMKSIPDRRGYFASLALFAHDNRPLLFAERGRHLAEGAVDGPVKFDTNVFQRAQPKPDDRVWNIQGSMLLSKPITVAPSGASLQYTVPIFNANNGPASAALVGVLELEPVFSEIARAFETRANRGTTISSMVIVVDHSGRILYHSDPAYNYQPARTAMPTFIPIADAMVAEQCGTQRFRWSDGQDYLVTFAPLPRLSVAV